MSFMLSFFGGLSIIIILFILDIVSDFKHPKKRYGKNWFAIMVFKIFLTIITALIAVFFINQVTNAHK